MLTPTEHPAARYSIAVAAVSAALAIALALRDLTGETRLIPFFPALIASAWYGGLGPGMVASLLSTALTAKLLPGAHIGQLIWPAVWLITSSGLAYVIARERTMRRRVAEQSAELQHQAALTRIVADNVTSCIWLLDERGRATFANAATERVTGYSPVELIGRRMHDMVHHTRPDGTPYPRSECPLMRALTAMQPMREVEDVLIRKDGTFFPAVISANPLLKSGAAVGTVVEVRDISAQKEAAKRQRTLGSLVESSPDFIGFATLDGAPLYLNVAGRGLVGLDSLEAVRAVDDVLAFYAPHDQERVRTDILPQVLAAGRWEGELMFRHFVTGEHIPVHQDLFTIVDTSTGHPEALATVCRDLRKQKQVEAELGAAAERFRFLAESMPQKIFSSLPDGQTEYLNQQWAEFTGLPDQELRDWGWTQIVHPDDLEENIRRWNQSLATGERFEMGHRLRRADGAYRWHLTRAHAMRDAGGAIIAWIGSSTDVDDIKRTERELGRSEARLQEEVRIVETLNRVGATVASTLDRDTVAQVVTDAATQLTAAQFGAFFYNVVNEAGEQYMLHTLSGTAAAAFGDFLHERAASVLGATPGKEIVRLDDVTRNPGDGKTPFGELNAEALPVRSYLAVPVKAASGAVLGRLFFGHPEPAVFTERHERLAVGIAGWAAVALENAALYRAAQESNRLKDEFLATLSHELRTPLNAILGWSYMLRSGTTPDRDRALDSIERNARIQAQLVEDLLDVSSVASGTLHLRTEKVELAAIITAAVDALRPAAVEKHIEPRVSFEAAGVIVRGDPRRLQQIVWNLLSNAIKFTPEHGRVDVTLRRLERHAEIVVRDTGPGVPPAFLPHVFSRFRQADASTTRRHGGLGLGLAIVKHLTEAHGGRVSVSSREGQGAVFTVRLPIDTIETDAARGAGVFSGRPERAER